MLKQAVVASVAGLLSAGFVWGQTQSASEEKPRSPAPSVIPATTPANPAPLPAARYSNYVEPTPRRSVIAASGQAAPNPGQNSPIPLPPPTLMPPAQPVMNALPDAAMPSTNRPASYDEKPTYATEMFTTGKPLTFGGRRSCGTVYIPTPYSWFTADMTFNWIKADKTVPLLTTGQVNSAVPGALGDPGTTVLFDGSRLTDNPFYGGKFSFGFWYEECQFLGGEIGYFFFGTQDLDFLAGANGFPGLPGLFVPFQNALTGAEDRFVIANPGSASGFAQINSRSQTQGADGHFLYSLWRGMSFRVDGLMGIRWLSLSETITMESHVRQFATPELNVATDVGILDRFGTRNDFVGGDVGLKTRLQRKCWTLDLLTRIAVGGNHQTFRGEGVTSVTYPNFPTVEAQGGRLIGPNNNGEFTRDMFSYAREFGITLGWQPKHWLRLTAGYNTLYWSNVIRPGDQIDRVVNPVGVPTRPEFNSDPVYEPQRPAVTFRASDIWMQSVTVGVQLLY